jgi:Uncharacterized protein conserved in bacteria
VSSRAAGALTALRERLAPLWPLHSFVATNPLMGRTSEHFEAALRTAIDDPLLGASPDGGSQPTEATAADRILIKWLSQYCTADQVAWEPPFPMDDFLSFARGYAHADPAVADPAPFVGAESAAEVLETTIEGTTGDDPADVLAAQLQAIPGWAGYVMALADDPTRSPGITLAQVCAVRLLLAAALDEPLRGLDRSVPPEESVGMDRLEAAESALRACLHDAVASPVPPQTAPTAALCFCIDTRSEPIRRALESQGSFVTYGAPGFFGLPLARCSATHGPQLACPPLFEDLGRMTDAPQTGTRPSHGWLRHLREVLHRLETGIMTAYTTVEARGWVDAVWLTTRTIRPTWAADGLTSLPGDGAEHLQMRQDVAIEHIAQLFDQIGLDVSIPVIGFIGHESRSRNNIHGSALDCGACGGHSGVANARALAALCNDTAVRAGLAARGVSIPDATIFVAGRHETTTDTVELVGGAPDGRSLPAVRTALASAGRSVAQSRAGSVTHARRRASDLAQPRPEWGLARNGGMVVGPRRFTAGADLDGRTFLQSYEHTRDPDGDVLASLLAGPVRVAHWINTQYLFSTLLPHTLGAGSKLYHNPLAAVGVRTAGFGDLRRGLPPSVDPSSNRRGLPCAGPTPGTRDRPLGDGHRCTRGHAHNRGPA